jgi:hypothetical protein
MDILDQLFEFDDYLDQDEDSVAVAGVTLKVPIGKWKAGSEFDYAQVYWTKSRLTLGIDHDDPAFRHEYVFNLKLTATDAPIT